MSRKGQQKGLLLLQKSTVPGAHTLLERTVVQLLQFPPHSLVQLPQGEELLVAQGGNNPRLSKAYGALGVALVPGLAHPGGHNGGTVVFSKFLITPVENHLVAIVGNRCGFTVVRNQKPGYTAEIVESVDMAQQPAFRPHILPSFCVDNAAAGQHGNEQIGRRLLAGN